MGRSLFACLLAYIIYFESLHAVPKCADHLLAVAELSVNANVKEAAAAAAAVTAGVGGGGRAGGAAGIPGARGSPGAAAGTRNPAIFLHRMLT